MLEGAHLSRMFEGVRVKMLEGAFLSQNVKMFEGAQVKMLEGAQAHLSQNVRFCQTWLGLPKKGA